MLKIVIGNNIARNSYILDENTTLRTALEEAGVDYSIGMTSLDGATLKAGDLDKTFKDFGIQEKCYLLNVVKADNAATVKVLGSACIVESAMTPEEIALLEKFQPKALSFYDYVNMQDVEVYRVALAKDGAGSLNKYGATFGGKSSTGKAIATMVIPCDVEDPKKWVVDNIGASLLNLNRVERLAVADLQQVKEDCTALEGSIMIL